MSTSKAILVGTLILSVTLSLIALLQHHYSPYEICKRELLDEFQEDQISLNSICIGGE